MTQCEKAGTLTEEEVHDLIAYIRSAAPHVKGNSEEGRKIYNGKGFCFQCHGYEGYIDRRPPMGRDMRRMLDELDPKPADHRNPVTLQSKNDQERFDTIRKGLGVRPCSPRNIFRMRISTTS
jgi:mono/diheme cytochrome c family protein